jgi:hypothetical protein
MTPRRVKGPKVGGTPDPYEKWLTRIQVMDTLGISHDTLKRWEHKGRLTPHHTMRMDRADRYFKTLVYDPQEVAALPRRHRSIDSGLTPGEAAARAYELFDQSKTIREVVMEIREPSERVRELRDQWLDDGGADLVISPDAKQALEAALGGRIDTAADLVKLVEGLAARE